MNSSSPVYRFLCFFKILEGLFARRARLDKEIVAHGGTPSRCREEMPSEYNGQVAFLASLFRGVTWNVGMVHSVFIPGVAGRRLSFLHQEPMRDLRNRVAHAVLDSGEPTVDADTQLDVRSVELWLPITKVLARYLLQTEFPTEFGTPSDPCPLQLIPIAEAQPQDGVYESPTISNVKGKASIVRASDKQAGR
jgi:hypothetical protein